MDNQTRTKLLQDTYSYLSTVRLSLGRYYSLKGEVINIDNTISPNQIEHHTLQELHLLYDRKITLMTEMEQNAVQIIKGIYSASLNVLMAMQMNIIAKDIINLIVDDNNLSAICAMIDQIRNERLIYPSVRQELYSGQCYFLLNDIAYKLQYFSAIPLNGFIRFRNLFNN